MVKETVETSKIHIGCGPTHIDGWINFDIQPFQSVDVVGDATRGLPIRQARFIFAEHFLEHLTFDGALYFLKDCKSVLGSNGVLRLSTPNLDWVWATSYSSRWRPTSPLGAEIRPTEWQHDEHSTIDCLSINLAFMGWGHRFLFNKSTLEYALLKAGFESLEWCDYGESNHVELSGLEQHSRDPDIAGVSDILIVEASGDSDYVSDQSIEEMIVEFRRKTAPNKSFQADHDPHDRGSDPLNFSR